MEDQKITLSEEDITRLVLETLAQVDDHPVYVPTGISVRHVHLEHSHLEKLFGPGYQLTFRKDLSQPGQFAAEETVDLIGPKGTIKKVRILGPVRKQTQVELALSDGRRLGIQPPVRTSGDLGGSPGIIIRGPLAEITISEGVIIADRHIHMTPKLAQRYQVTNGEKVRVVIEGEKSGSFDDVTIRVSEQYALDFHIDTDDGNAFLLKQGQLVSLVKK